ncbi:hypothetical protein CK203_044848 [Vitis vinifera]|uniref:Uncharacterized protein n=1 Tax=Vitis vinifera TaxID=29760 RepID=A0A438H0Q3_VITVI|nr:hypothetical protein CK203_044848 [Vitis vinifera]
MVERFFSGKITETAGQDAGNFTLLSGPPSCGKTSLLFQFAFNAAVEGHSGNRDVVFICTRRRLESKPPCLSQGVDPSSDMFQHVQMKYVEDDEAIKKYFAAFHLHHKFPVAVIIDDFGDFFDERTCQERYNSPRGRDLAMVRTLALCRSAILHANLFDMISELSLTGGDGSGSFLLTNGINSGSGSSGRTRTAKYSIALQYLFLEDVTEDDDT